MTSPTDHIARVAIVGNHLPRRCGIATFTTDLCEAIASTFPRIEVFALPVNDRESGYDYPPRVRFEIQEQDLSSYRQAGDFLNICDINVVCLQHEYGIFGGTAGSHILALLKELRMPVVTTLHTVLRNPDRHQRRVLGEIAARSQRLVVMSERGREFLREIYAIPEAKIEFIPHGIPDVPFVDPSFHKDRFGAEGRKVLLTFGLLSPGKGIEHAIRALPAIRERHPDLLYLVVGATHPGVRARDGEAYRQSLVRLVDELGLQETVRFHNRFVDLAELIEFIGAADVYLTPYLDAEQITSGTLAYAVGAGKAVISTPYWYAQDLLADGRGILVPFRDPSAIAREVTALFDDPAARHAMRKRAYLFGRNMIWPQVAAAYLDNFTRAKEDRGLSLPIQTRAPTTSLAEAPELRLDHLRRLTDSTGLIQHTVFTIPNYGEGYATDDNARGLVLAVYLEHLGEDLADQALDLATRYMAFLNHAWNQSARRFRNFLSYQRSWLEEAGSDDCQGHCFWALGAVLGRSRDEGLRALAGSLFERALPSALEVGSPRAWAATLIGIHEYLRRYPGDRTVREIRAALAERLLDLFRRVSRPDWPWFEESLTYCNARLPHALLMSGQWMARSEMRDAGISALDWLSAQQRDERGHHVPIGSAQPWRREGERPRFDQQPIEAQSTLSGCLEAWRTTGEQRWRDEAGRCFTWFLGRNDLGIPLYDAATGGCRDGLHSDRVNHNRGAESTLAYLLSAAELRLAQDHLAPQDGDPVEQGA